MPILLKVVDFTEMNSNILPRASVIVWNKWFTVFTALKFCSLLTVTFQMSEPKNNSILRIPHFLEFQKIFIYNSEQI